MQFGKFLGRLPEPSLKTVLPLLKNVLKPLAKSVLTPLGLAAAASAADLTAAASASDREIHKQFSDQG